MNQPLSIVIVAYNAQVSRERRDNIVAEALRGNNVCRQRDYCDRRSWFGLAVGFRELNLDPGQQILFSLIRHSPFLCDVLERLKLMNHIVKMVQLWIDVGWNLIR